jgi:hypothetical protein
MPSEVEDLGSSNETTVRTRDETYDVSAKFTDRTFRLIDTITNSLARTEDRKGFIESAVGEHTVYILEQVEGQKSIRDFAKDLSADVKWINLQPDTKFRINTKLEPNQSLVSSPQRLTITQSERDFIKQIMKCTDLRRSDVIRLCAIREMAEVSKTANGSEFSVKGDPVVEGLLTQTKRNAILERWLDLDNKLQKVIDELIFDLYGEITSPKFQQFSRLESHSTEIRAIIDHYEHDFKGSAGYRTMKEGGPNGLGERVIGELDGLVADMEDVV